MFENILPNYPIPEEAVLFSFLLLPCSCYDCCCVFFVVIQKGGTIEPRSALFVSLYHLLQVYYLPITRLLLLIGASTFLIPYPEYFFILFILFLFLLFVYFLSFPIIFHIPPPDLTDKQLVYPLQ